MIYLSLKSISMKSLVLIFFIFLAINCQSQKQEGHIDYDITFSSDDPETTQMLAMMDGSSMEVYFLNSKTRTGIKLGFMLDMQITVDESTDEAILLVGGMMGKKYIKTTQKEMQQNDEIEQDKVKIELVKGTKNIQGYDCKKAIGTDAKGNVSEYWYTEKLNFNKTGNQFIQREVPGVPLEISTNVEELTITITANLVEKKITNAEQIFSTEVPEGYTISTFAEFLEMGQ